MVWLIWPFLWIIQPAVAGIDNQHTWLHYESLDSDHTELTYIVSEPWFIFKTHIYATLYICTQVIINIEDKYKILTLGIIYNRNIGVQLCKDQSLDMSQQYECIYESLDIMER